MATTTQQPFRWSLAKIFGLYTVAFLGVTILIGLAEQFLGLPNRWIGWLFMALSLGIYIVIGVITRTSDSDQYYVAGRGVPALYNGMATGSDWMSAASFISMAGALSVQGFSGLAYVMGWTGGYVLLAVFLGPYLRQFGAYTIPDFLGGRYGGIAPRLVGVLAAILCSFTYLIAQVTGVGLIVSRFLGLDFNIGVFVGLVGVLFCSVLGGMRSVTWTQVAQYIILIISYLVPVVVLSWQLFTFPFPQFTYGQLLQRNNAAAIQVTNDPKEAATRAAWKRDADAATAKLKAPGAVGRRAGEADRPAEDGGSAGEAARRPGRDHRKLPDGPQGRGDVELPRAHLLPDGGHGWIAPHPDPLLHDTLGQGSANLRRLGPVLHLPPVLHGPGLRRLRPVRGLHPAGRNADRRPAAVGDAVETRRPLRRGGQARGRGGAAR